MEKYYSRKIEQLKPLLFINFGISPEKAKEYLEDMKVNPQKIPNYEKLIDEKMEDLYDAIKFTLSNDIKDMAKKRVEEWTKIFGTISKEEYWAMGEDGKHALAKLACDMKLGVRGLKSLLQQVLLEDMYDLEVGQERFLEVTEEYIKEKLKNKIGAN